MSRSVSALVFVMCAMVGLCALSARADTKAGLVGYWPLDGDATDGSTNTNDGTLVGDVQAVPDRYGVAEAALRFPGEADAYVDLGDPEDLQISGAMTLTAWVFLNGSNANDGRIISRRDDNGVLWDLGIETSPGGAVNALTFGVAGGTPDVVRVTDTQSLATDQWVHVTGIYYPGEALEIYVDGFPRADVLLDVPAGQAIGSGASVLIGGRQGCSDCGWDGLIDEVRIYDRAISQVEIWQIMRANVGCSSGPHPANGATGVVADVILRWTAGLFAKSHDLYFGTVFTDVNDAGRTNPNGVLLGRGLSRSQYEAPNSTLEFGQTYYWRVDEVNALESHIYKGNVWTFTVEPYAPALEPVVATSNATSGEGEGPANTVNGSGLNANDEHSVEATDMWLGAADGGDPVWIRFRFDTVYKLSEMLIWNYNGPSEASDGAGLKDVTVEYSIDGATWNTLRNVQLAQGAAAPDYAANTTVNLGGISAKYVRLTVQTNWGATNQYGLSEVRFFHVPARARAPRPADGETGVDVNLVLQWSVGRGATLHDVHFSNSAPIVATGAGLVGSTTTNQYALRPLDFGTTYYWRVDELSEVPNASAWQGEIWNFTTREYAAIDDFESYTDNPGRRIYQTWRDGYDNQTGATVGHWDPPYAEQNIVHGGGQSMPFEYNNPDAPFYSETTRSTGTNQDWQSHGADALRLFVYGHADNDPGTLYVALEDTNGHVAVATHHDPALLTRTTWQAWVIPYSAFEGVRMSGVAKVYLGVGDRDNPTPGGTGLIYIDDVEFGHPIGGVVEPRR